MAQTGEGPLVPPAHPSLRLARGPRRATAEAAHRLTGLLGDHHDLAVLRGDLAGRSFSREDSEALAAAISSREDELASAAFGLGHRLYAERPKAFRRRIRAYWRAWREG